MKYTFHIVDIFSSTPFGGNQLAVLPDASSISTEGMQKIAREFNFGETTFVLPKKDPANTCRVRIFTLMIRVPPQSAQEREPSRRRPWHQGPGDADCRWNLFSMYCRPVGQVTLPIGLLRPPR
jgi:hypothetical protein